MVPGQEGEDQRQRELGGTVEGGGWVGAETLDNANNVKQKRQQIN